jgi:hypothetical protein
MKTEQITLEKNNIKLTEFNEPTFTHFDKVFIQIGCCGLYANTKELKDLLTVINYYLNVDDITEIKVNIGGDYVKL